MPSLPSTGSSPSSASVAAEEQRLQVLHSYNVLYTAAEQEFDTLVALASAICETPISLISLVTKDRQWFKAGVGLAISETPLSVSFCQYAIEQDEVLEIPDTQSDIRFFQNPYVTGDPKIRFYAGSPLVNKDGFKLGTLCVIDTEPRELTEKQRFALATLSEQVVAHLELRLKTAQLEKEKQQLENVNNILSQLNYFGIATDSKATLASMKMLIEKLESAIPEEKLPSLADSVLLLKRHILQLETDIQKLAIAGKTSEASAS